MLPAHLLVLQVLQRHPGGDARLHPLLRALVRGQRADGLGQDGPPRARYRPDVDEARRPRDRRFQPQTRRAQGDLHGPAQGAGAGEEGGVDRRVRRHRRRVQGAHGRYRYRLVERTQQRGHTAHHPRKVRQHHAQEQGQGRHVLLRRLRAGHNRRGPPVGRRTRRLARGGRVPAQGSQRKAKPAGYAAVLGAVRGVFRDCTKPRRRRSLARRPVPRRHPALRRGVSAGPARDQGSRLRPREERLDVRTAAQRAALRSRAQPLPEQARAGVLRQQGRRIVRGEDTGG